MESIVANLFHSGVLYITASVFFGVICVYGMKLLIDIRTQLRNLNIRTCEVINELEEVNGNLINIENKDTQ